MKNLHFIKLSVFLLFVLVISLFNIVIREVYAAVTLVRFEVVYVTHTSIVLEWETATEYNNLGFFVLRSDTEGGTYEQIGDFIPAEGTAVSGYIYQFTDDLVLDEQIYFYKLEAIDLNSVSEFFGPVSNGLLTTATQTNTPTRTSTGLTGTPQLTTTITATLTATVSPTLTETSPFSFFTNTATDTKTVTPVTTASDEITITETVTPTELPTEIVVKTSTSQKPEREETPVQDQDSSQQSAVRSLAIGFLSIILLGGVSIGGLLIYSKRKQSMD